MFRPLLPGLVLACVVFAGCMPLDPIDPPDCQVRGYPCSLAEVDPGVLERTEALSVQIATMLDSGTPMTDAVAFIDAEDGVVEVHSDHAALCFRLDGGRHAWIMTPEAFAPDLAAQASDAGSKTIRRAAEPPSRKDPLQSAHVVGDDPDVKRAIVLSPFKYEFTVQDEGAAVAQILDGTRGYAGNVTYLENATRNAGTVGIEQFKGWDNYDIVLVSGHGTTICQGTDCVSLILTGDEYNSVEELSHITDPGVNTLHVAGQNSGRLALSPDFFRFQYGAGLERTIIFFNGCKTYGAGPLDPGSLSQALLGEGSVYLGWSDTVHADIAYVASVGLFSDLADNGVTVQSAADRLGNVATDAYTSKNGAPIEALLLVDRPADRDLRAREVAMLEQPNGGGELTEGATVAVNGMADDGVPDLVPFQVFVDGVEEGQEDRFIVTVTVDGHSSTPADLVSGERVGEHGIRISGEIPYIDVGPSQDVELRAEVQLPEGGTSVHVVPVTLTAESDDALGAGGSGGSGGSGGGGGAAPEVWMGEASGSLQLILGSDGVVNVTAMVTFQQTASSIGQPTKRLKVTGGTMYWTRSGVATDFQNDCPYTTGPIEVPIESNDGEILIDTTTSPHTYTMHAFTNGPVVQAAENCGDLAFSTTAQGVWIPTIDQYGQFSVSADGGTIEGDTASGQREWTWSFQRQP